MFYDSTNRKPYPKAPHYLVSKDGCVWLTRFRNNKCTKILDVPRKMKTRIRATYPCVSYRENGVHFSESVHVMVLETFVGPRPYGFQCAHKDGNPLNPRLENLMWTTKAENNRHKYIHGTMPFGEKTKASKLTDAIVLDIREKRKAGVLTHVLASRYSVAGSTIRRIVSGKRWAHLPLLKANGFTVSEATT